MRHSHYPLCFAILLASTSAAAAQSNAAAVEVLGDVKYLSSDGLGGRFTGSAGADSAAAYLARRFASAGLDPSPNGWFQPFTVSPDAPALAHAQLTHLSGKNVIGVLPGRDRKLRGEVVIVGAHYDHLGPGGFGSLDPDSTGTVHNGADDNASGSAALIYIAEQLAKRPPKRTVVFLAFSGEELGLLGSAFYTKAPAFPLDSTIAMVNLDMVGRLRNDRIIVYGVETAREFRGILDSANATAKLDLKAQGDGYGPSDQSSFYSVRLPVLHVFTDLHEDYHRTTDDWDKINADGLVRVADFTAAVVRAIADRPSPQALTFVDLPKPPPPTGGGGYGAYLGTIPDMTENPGGVRLSGVRAGGPAAQAGLRAGDVITRIGDHDVTDLQTMTDALRSYKPGDTVDIVVTRDGTVTVLKATLGSRGG